MNSPHTAAFGRDNVNIGGQISGSSHQNVQLQTPAIQGVLKSAQSDQQQNFGSDQQKQVRFQSDQDVNYLSSTSHQPSANVPINLHQHQAQQQVQSQIQNVAAFQQQTQHIANPQLPTGDAHVQQQLQSVVNLQQTATGATCPQQTQQVPNPDSRLSAVNITHQLQPLLRPDDVFPFLPTHQQGQQVTPAIENVLVAEIQQNIQCRIKENFQSGVAIDATVLATQVQQQMPLGINLDPTILLQEVQKQMTIFAEQNQIAVSSNVQQQLRADDQISTTGSLPQQVAVVAGQMPTISQTQSSVYSAQQLQPQQQGEEYCRMVAFRSDGSRREFLIREQDGHQVLSLCAQADVSDPRNYSGLNTSLMSPQQITQNFPQHWTLEDLHTDTSSSLATRSVHSAASGGIPCQSVPSDTIR